MGIKVEHVPDADIIGRLRHRFPGMSEEEIFDQLGFECGGEAWEWGIACGMQIALLSLQAGVPLELLEKSLALIVTSIIHGNPRPNAMEFCLAIAAEWKDLLEPTAGGD